MCRQLPLLLLLSSPVAALLFPCLPAKAQQQDPASPDGAAGAPDRQQAPASPAAAAGETAQPVQPVQLSPMAAAVVDKFLACYTAEGGEVLPEDRQLLGELSAQLLRGLDGMLEEGSCAGEPGSCAGQIGALDCQALGPRLADELAPELGDLLGTELLAGLADEPPTAWAESYTMALGGKILDCYADELGQPPSGEEVAMVDGFRLQLARLLTLLTSRGSCKVDEQRQSGCTDALRAAPCAGLAEALTTSGQQLVETLTGACAGFLDCEARPQLDDLGGPRATRTGQALPTTPAEAR